MTDDDLNALINDVPGGSRNHAADSCSDCGDAADVHVDGIGEPSGSREVAGISLCAQCFQEVYGG
jgi:hypothetical protein